MELRRTGGDFFISSVGHYNYDFLPSIFYKNCSVLEDESRKWYPINNMKYKVVVDTNLFVAAYYNPNSASAQIINMIARRDLILVWSDDIAREIYKILENSKASDKFTRKIKNKALREENRVEPKIKIKEVKEDPDDDKFLEAAVEGGVDYIVTSDQHLLRVGKFQEIPIYTPTNFWQLIRG